jgi:hypothetical protein
MCASFIALRAVNVSCAGKIVVSKLKTDMLLYVTLQFSSCLENADRLAEYEDLTDGILIHEILLQMYVIVVIVCLYTADIFNISVLKYLRRVCIFTAVKVSYLMRNTSVFMQRSRTNASWRNTMFG